jgi:tRNA threonylcarbamoyladenosine biosynthesis protein TsaE
LTVERFSSDGPQATEAIGAGLAARLKPGDVVFVLGELGAGKTTLVRGACRALGVEGPVTSPTFAIGNRYLAAGGMLVSHLDLYRLDGGAREDPDLLADYLGEEGIVLVEWGGAKLALGTPAFTVELFHAGGDHRRIEVRS